MILPAAEGKIGSRLWDRVDARRALAARLLGFVATLDGPQAVAGELLLFEVICEKSYPLDVAVLARELASDAHIAKIRHKVARGFYGSSVPGTAAAAGVLDEVRRALRETL